MIRRWLAALRTRRENSTWGQGSWLDEAVVVLLFLFAMGVGAAIASGIFILIIAGCGR